MRTSVYIPENSYVYQKLQGINEASKDEDAKSIIDDIKANPEVYLKAELRAKKDYLRRDALVEGSPNYMVTIAQLQYLTQLETKAMAGIDDILVSM